MTEANLPENRQDSIKPNPSPDNLFYLESFDIIDNFWDLFEDIEGFQTALKKLDTVYTLPLFYLKRFQDNYH